MVTALLGTIALLAWAFAGPVNDTPDEDFHLASIWCGWGDDAHCGPGTTKFSRTVPGDLVVGSLCDSNRPEQSAACLPSDFGQHPEQTVSTTRGNFRPEYPPVYYAVLRSFVGHDVVSSVVRMRAFNVLLAVVLVGLALRLLPERLRRAVAVALLVTSVPFGIYMVSSINPTGWLVLTGGLLWAALASLVSTDGAHRAALAALALGVATMGAGARADGATFNLLAVAASACLVVRSGRPARWFWGVSGGVLAVSVVCFLSGHQSRAAIEGFGAHDRDLSTAQLLWYNLTQLPGLCSGSFGGYPLGWIDTTLPAAVLFCALGAWCATVVIGLQHGAPRKTVALAGIGGALVAYPLFLLMVSQLIVGEGVQPRYLLPMIVLFTGLAVLPTGSRRFSLARGQRAVLAVALTIANGVALHTQIRRYVTGLDVVGFDLDRHAEWWWSDLFSPMTVWAAGTAAFGLVAVLLLARYAAAPTPAAASER